MKREEFVRELKNRYGCETEYFEDYEDYDDGHLSLLIIRNKEKQLVATIDESQQYIFTIFNQLLDIDFEDRSNFYYLLVKYSGTDIKERRKGTEYYIRHKGIIEDSSYLRNFVREDFYKFGSKVQFVEDFSGKVTVKTRFSKGDIGNVPDWVVRGLKEDGDLLLVECVED